MKKTILERYPRHIDNKYVIDINAGKISDLYNDFDKFAPYVRKELDPDLVDYISDSARELGKSNFVICFRFLEPADTDMQDRIKKSISNYFLYLKSVEMQKLGRTMLTSSIFLLIGITLLFVSVVVNSGITDQSTVIQKVIAQGLTVAAWVSLWEALATLLISWLPASQKMSLYKKIANCMVEFA